MREEEERQKGNQNWRHLWLRLKGILQKNSLIFKIC